MAVRFEAPSTVDAVLGALEDEEAMLLGGGTLIALLLKSRLITPSTLVSLSKVESLKELMVREDGSLWIGAGVTIAALARSVEVQRDFAPLALAASEVGNPRVRSVATVGGHLAHADPRQDLPPVLLAFGARVSVASTGGCREMPMDDLVLGLMETSLDDKELILGVTVPARAGCSGTYLRYKPVSTEDYATVSVAVELALGPDERVERAVVALGGVGPVALLVAEAGAALAGQEVGEETMAAAAAAVREAVAPTDDQRGSAAYKVEMAGLFTRRALAGALARLVESSTKDREV